MLVLLRRTSFWPPSMVYISIIIHHTYHKLPAGPLRAASMHCSTSCPCDLWALLRLLSPCCAESSYVPCLTVNHLSPLGVQHLRLDFCCSSMEMWAVDICEKRIRHGTMEQHWNKWKCKTDKGSSHSEIHWTKNPGYATRVWNKAWECVSIAKSKGTVKKEIKKYGSTRDRIKALSLRPPAATESLFLGFLNEDLFYFSK